MSDESLFREVEEEVRREKVLKLWNRYGNYIVALSIGVILAVVAIKGWQYWQKSQSEAAGKAYVDAMILAESGKQAEADKSFADIADGGHSGFAKLARLQQAASLAEADKRDAAIKAYDEIAADSKLVRPLRDMARVRSGYLLADTAPLDELKRRLAGLDLPASAWRNQTREILAIAAYREAKYAEANTHLKAILGDVSAPPSIRQRTQVFASFLKSKLTDGGKE